MSVVEVENPSWMLQPYSFFRQTLSSIFAEEIDESGKPPAERSDANSNLLKLHTASVAVRRFKLTDAGHYMTDDSPEQSNLTIETPTMSLENADCAPREYGT
jgi:hypothetical protein